MAIVEVNNTTLECVEKGSGEPVVLVHGSASDYRTWHSKLEAFGGRYRTIAYSRRYHWPNARIADGVDYSMTEHVDDLRALLHALGAVLAHVVGHSYGAMVSLLLAIREPEMVRTLVLAEPPAITLFVSDPPRPAQILKLLFSRPRTAFAIVKLGATGFAPAAAACRRDDMDAAMRVFGRAVLGRRSLGELSESRLEQVMANAIKAEFLGSGIAPIDDNDIRAVHTSTLLVGGARSPRVFARLLDRLEELLPRSRRVEVPGASHIVYEDNAPAWNDTVMSFLAHPSVESQ